MKIHRKISNYQADHIDIAFQANVPLNHAKWNVFKFPLVLLRKRTVLHMFPGHLAAKTDLNARRITLRHQHKAYLFKQPVQ